MITVLEANLAQTKYSSNWLVDAGDLRQIGKTTTLIKIAKDFKQPKDSFLSKINFQQKFNVVFLSLTADTKIKKELNDFSVRTVSTLDSLEHCLTGLYDIVLLVDDARFYEIDRLEKIVKENDLRILFKAGWK